jgi:RHS repeat-associated protein
MFGTASYTYDAGDNLRHVAVTGGSQARDQDYCYDEHWRLTNVKTGGCDGGTTVVGLGYDAQGNLANKSGVFYTFDYGNRMRSGGPESYRYDVQGRRIRSINSTGQVIYSLYAQSGQLLFQRDERSGKRRQYIYLGGSLVAESDLPLVGSTATVTYQHTDALGSPVAVTDQSRTVIERTEYEPYGKVLNRPLHDGPGYTGHVEDAATGLVYMQARYCDPTIGRCLSVDPVTAYDNGDMRYFNRYAYAFNSPYSFTDPDGRCPTCDRFSDNYAQAVKQGRQGEFNAFVIPAAIVVAVLAAPVVAEVGTAALANPGTANAIASGIIEAGAGEALGGASLAAGAGAAASKLKPGAFAAESIPARSASQTFTSGERAAVNEIGQATGCHSCGTTNPGTKSGNFVPDHQPVSSLNTANAPQRLYPQCLTCSRQQGLEAAKELRNKDK